MTENMKQFLELVATDENLKAELDVVHDAHDGKDVGDLQAMT